MKDSKDCETSEEQEVSVHSNVRFTDWICTILFFIFIVLMVFISSYAYFYGDPDRITNNYDCYGNVCDRQNNPKIVNNSNSGISTKGRKYVFQTVSIFWKWSRSLCVKQCPNVTIWNKVQLHAYTLKTHNSLCSYEKDVTKNKTFYEDSYDYELRKTGNTSLIRLMLCPFLPVFPSSSVMGFCLLDNVTSERGTGPIAKAVGTKVDIEGNGIAGLNRMQPNNEAFLRDFVILGPEIIALCSGSIVLACLVIVSIRFLPRAFPYATLILTFIVSTCLVIFLWVCHFFQRAFLDQQAKKSQGFLILETANEYGFLMLALFGTILDFFLWGVLAIFLVRIRVTPLLITYAWTPIKQLPCLLLVPLFTLLLLIGFLSYWSVTLTYIMSLSNVEIIPGTGCVQFVAGKLTYLFCAVHCFFLLWGAEFIVTCQQMVISGVISDWYFARLSTPSYLFLLRWIGRSVVYHSGSIAMGSLINSVSRLPRSFMLYLRMRVLGNNSRRKEPDCCQCCRSCLQRSCFLPFFCLESGCQFFTKTSFSLIALRSDNFIQSGRESYANLFNHPERLSALNASVDFLFLITKVMISALLSSAAIFIFMNRNGIYFYPLSVAFIAVFSFYIGHAILSLFESIIDSILVCYSLEIENVRTSSEELENIKSLIQTCVVILNGSEESSDESVQLSSVKPQKNNESHS